MHVLLLQKKTECQLLSRGTQLDSVAPISKSSMLATSNVRTTSRPDVSCSSNKETPRATTKTTHSSGSQGQLMNRGNQLDGVAPISKSSLLATSNVRTTSRPDVSCRSSNKETPCATTKTTHSSASESQLLSRGNQLDRVAPISTSSLLATSNVTISRQDVSCRSSNKETPRATTKTSHRSYPQQPQLRVTGKQYQRRKHRSQKAKCIHKTTASSSHQ